MFCAMWFTGLPISAHRLTFLHFLHLTFYPNVRKKIGVQLIKIMASNKRKRSILWTYFLESEDPRIVTCTICREKVNYSGTTTNLKCHLERHHEQIYKTLLEEDSKVKQLKVTDFEIYEVNKEAKFPSNSFIAKKITNSIAYMIVADLRPISIVEDKGFRTHCQITSPRYQMVDSKHIKGVINDMYNEQKDIILKIFNSDLDIHITTDGWTDTNKFISYFTVTCHFVDQEFKIQSYCLETKYFPLRHTAENIKNMLKTCFDAWNIFSKVKTVTTDNASNMIKAVTDGQWQHYSCFAHTLHLVVTESLKLIDHNGNLHTLLEKARTIVHTFKSSDRAACLLRSAQQSKGVGVYSIKKEIKTRWNSTLIMLKSLNKLKEHLTTVTSVYNLEQKQDVPYFSMNDWKMIEQLIDILEILECASKEMSSENYVSTSKIIPIIQCILSELRELKDLDKDIDDLKKNLIKHVDQRFGPYTSSLKYGIYTYLDPRFKHYLFNNKEFVQKIRDYLKKEMTEIEISDGNFAGSDIMTDKTECNEGEFDKNSNRLWKSFDSKISTQEEKSPATRHLIQLKQYEEQPLLHRNRDPLEYWKDSEFMTLKKIAKKYHGKPATTVPSERIFSKAGVILKKKRSQLDPKMVDQIIFLNANLK